MKVPYVILLTSEGTGEGSGSRWQRSTIADLVGEILFSLRHVSAVARGSRKGLEPATRSVRNSHITR